MRCICKVSSVHAAAFFTLQMLAVIIFACLVLLPCSEAACNSQGRFAGLFSDPRESRRLAGAFQCPSIPCKF
jgi:hypothetical protein